MTRLFCIVLCGTCFQPGTVRGHDDAEHQKPLAKVGVFSMSLNSSSQISVDWALTKEVHEQRQGTRTVCKTVFDSQEQSYSVDLDGRKEQRTRTINVPRQVQEEVPYTYSVCIPVEEPQPTLQMPKMFRLTYAGLQQVTGTKHARRILQELTSTDDSAEKPKALFVRTTADAEKLWETISTKLGGASALINISFVIATDESQYLGRDEKPIATAGTLYQAEHAADGIKAIYGVGVPYTEQMTVTRSVCRTVMESVEKDGKTIQVPRQVQEQVPYTYTVTKLRLEQRTVGNAAILVSANDRLIELSQDDTLPTNKSILVVASRDDAYKAFLSMRRNLQFNVPDLAETIDTTGLKSIIPTTFLVTAPAASTDAPAAAVMKQQSPPIDAPAPPAQSVPAPRAAAPRWPLPTEKGAWVNSLPYSQKLLNGKSMVLWFYEEGCPRCRSKWSELQQMARYFSRQKVLFVAVNSGNSAAQVAAYAKQVDARTAIIVDTDRSLEKAAGVPEINLENIYQLVVFDPNGKLHQTGTLDMRVAGEKAAELAK